MFKLEPYTLDVEIAVAGTPVRASSTTGKLARWVLIQGNKTAKLANSGTIYVGTQEGDAGMSGGAINTQPFPVMSGDQFLIAPPDGCCIDLYDLWLDADFNGDHAIILYLA